MPVRSSGVSGRPIGMPRMRSCHADPDERPSICVHSISICFHIGVSTTPGQIALIVTCGANARAADCVTLIAAALLAAYAANSGRPAAGDRGDVDDLAAR